MLRVADVHVENAETAGVIVVTVVEVVVAVVAVVTHAAPNKVIPYVIETGAIAAPVFFCLFIVIFA